MSDHELQRAPGLGVPLLAATMMLFGCTAGVQRAVPAVPGDELALDARAEAQRRSLGYLFYRDNGAPPAPSAPERRRLDHALRDGPQIEVSELRERFGDDVELLVLATRDTDGDGILDYRISEHDGKFFEGDLDLDGDGIRNVYDIAPYVRQAGAATAVDGDGDGDGAVDGPGSFADSDGDQIPDHLDWSGIKPLPLASIQSGLLGDFGVILVERSARFSPELVQAIDDTLRLVFREPLSPLRTIAVEEQLLLGPDDGVNGFMCGQTQTLTVYTNSTEGAPPVVLLGLVVHEVAHAWQFAQDFDGSDPAGENKKMHFPPGVFTMSLEGFGWKIDQDTLEVGYQHQLYWPHFYATSPRYLYEGSTPAQWAMWFGELERDVGPEFLSDEGVTSRGIVGTNSLLSPWEWHADHLMASIYNRIDRGIEQHQDPDREGAGSGRGRIPEQDPDREGAGSGRGRIPKQDPDREGAGSGRGRIPKHDPKVREMSSRMLQAVQAQWSRFDYRNGELAPIEGELARRFGIDDSDIVELVERYVAPLGRGRLSSS